MLSVKQTKKFLSQIISMAGAEGITLQFHQREKVFNLTIEPTTQIHPLRTYKEVRRLADKKGNVALVLETCPICKGLLVSGTCINKNCLPSP